MASQISKTPLYPAPDDQVRPYFENLGPLLPVLVACRSIIDNNRNFESIS